NRLAVVGIRIEKKFLGTGIIIGSGYYIGDSFFKTVISSRYTAWDFGSAKGASNGASFGTDVDQGCPQQGKGVGIFNAAVKLYHPHICLRFTVQMTLQP